MRAALRRLHSPDVFDLVNYQPDPADDFGFLLQALVGPEGGVGEESFDFVVCTPKWLERRRKKSDVIFGRHHLIMFEYDYDRLLRTIEHLCDSAEGNSWDEIATKLARFGKWEFEDYKD